jgi:hypothetical protein
VSRGTRQLALITRGIGRPRATGHSVAPRIHALRVHRVVWHSPLRGGVLLADRLIHGCTIVTAGGADLRASGASTAAGGCLAYAAATLFFSLILFKPGSCADIKCMKRENLPWFLSSAVLGAISQALVYASLAAAPLMVVTPILQLSLVFRLFLSQLINRGHEVTNTAVPHRCLHRCAGFDPGLARHRRLDGAPGPVAVDRRLPALPHRRPLSSGPHKCASGGGVRSLRATEQLLSAYLTTE